MSEFRSGGAPTPGRPASLRERRRSHPTRASRLALSAAVLLIPASARQRYTTEFLAELHDVERPLQLRHALGLLAHSWELRLAVRKFEPHGPRSATMRKALRCRLNIHHFVVRRNAEVQPPDRYLECTRCGRTENVRQRPVAFF